MKSKSRIDLLKKHRILAVDDEPDLLEILEFCLDDAGLLNDSEFNQFLVNCGNRRPIQHLFQIAAYPRNLHQLHNLLIFVYILY